MRLRRIFTAVVALVMFFVLWQDSYLVSRLSPLSVVIGTRTRQEYLENTIGYTPRAMQALEDLPEDSRILMLWEPRGLYAPLNAQADLWIDRWRTDRRELGKPEKILRRWKDEGFTHLLVYTPGVDLIAPQPGEQPGMNWLVLQETLAQLPEPTPIGDTYLLYPLP